MMTIIEPLTGNTLPVLSMRRMVMGYPGASYGRAIIRLVATVPHVVDCNSLLRMGFQQIRCGLDYWMIYHGTAW